MPRLPKPPPRNVVVNATCAPAVKGRTTKSSRTAAPPPPPPARRAKHALNDLSNQSSRRGTAGKTEDAALQPVRHSTRILALQQKQQQQQQKSDNANAKMPSTRHGTTVTRSRGATVRTTTTQEPSLRRSSRVLAQKLQGSAPRRDSLQSLGNVINPKSQVVRRTSARTASTAALTNDGSLGNNSRKHSTESVDGSDHSSKRQKTSTNGSNVDRFALPSGVTGTAECGIAPLDQRHVGNVSQVPEYASQIYQYLYVMETRFKANSYTTTHLYLRDIDRFDVIDWLLKLAEAWKCEPPVAFLAVQILDRYLAEVPVQMDDLQLVAAVTLWLASKYEEVEALTMHSLLMVINQYAISEIVETERLILEQLHYGTYG
eukprot:scaffold1506_cov179-Amphora_coffeaeformis.AAC.16